MRQSPVEMDYMVLKKDHCWRPAQTSTSHVSPKCHSLCGGSIKNAKVKHGEQNVRWDN